MKYILLLLVVCLAWACTSTGFKRQDPKKYTNTSPKFIIQEHLGGDIVSEGLLFGPSGKMEQSFVAQMKGTWDGNKGVLREEFVFSNGTKQLREWQITLLADNKFTATAADVIGTATGDISGSTLRMAYNLKLTEAAGGHVLNVIDWIYLTEDGTMINKSEMRKFGIKVAELVGTIRPAP